MLASGDKSLAYVKNSGSGTFVVTVAGTFRDYNPVTGAQTTIVGAAANNCTVGTTNTKCLSDQTQIGGSGYTVPNGHFAEGSASRSHA